jgi:hypothetical protein
MVIPYVDINPKGSGYYTVKERPFALGMFIFGFLVLWISLIAIGTFLRGPGWYFFKPWHYWDPHKVVALTNQDWAYLLLGARKESPLDDLVGEITVGETYFFREAAQFEFIRWNILRDLLARREPGHVLRAWSAGCASGEEAYSLAILLTEEGLADRARVEHRRLGLGVRPAGDVVVGLRGLLHGHLLRGDHAQGLQRHRRFARVAPFHHRRAAAADDLDDHGRLDPSAARRDRLPLQQPELRAEPRARQ